MPQNPIPVSVYGPSYGTPSIQTSIVYDLTSLTWAANVVTAVTVDPLPDTLAVGDLFSVTIIGEDPVGYNGQFLATVTGASGFTYPLGSDPGSENSPGTFTILTSIIKDSPGVLATVSVVAAGSAGSLTFNNCTTLATVTDANTVFTIDYSDLTVGEFIKLYFPCNVGIVLSAIPTDGIVSVTFS